MKISYAITVCNEFIEIQRLLNFLIKNIKGGDEIVVQHDSDNTTLEVLRVLNKYADRVKVIEFPLNGHFANFKNNLTDECSGDYIFQIDADEMLTTYTIDFISDVLRANSTTDVFKVPRVNTVEGITEKHIQTWGWKVDDQQWINFPDYQWRIYKNNKQIKWINQVHEVLTGYQSVAHLPAAKEWSLIHDKTIERQEKQNKLYEGL